MEHTCELFLLYMMCPIYEDWYFKSTRDPTDPFGSAKLEQLRFSCQQLLL